MKDCTDISQTDFCRINKTLHLRRMLQLELKSQDKEENEDDTMIILLQNAFVSLLIISILSLDFTVCHIFSRML